MKVPFVDLYAQYLTIKDDIDSSIQKVITQTAFIRGPFVSDFEKAWAQTTGARHCLSCANGTDALYIALRGLKIKKGDEVIAPAHTWISTTEAITQAGGRVVFCDTDPDTFTINSTLIEEKITSKTVGIIPVHLYGQPCDMDDIQRIAKKNKLWILEDCAQAHLATYKGKQVGSFGQASTFSFYPGKNLGAYGDGGCVITNDDQLAEWTSSFARHGGKSNHEMEGINSRLDGLQAAILSAKLPHLKKWIEARRKAARQYSELLKGVGDVVLPLTKEDRDHTYHLYVIRTQKRDSLKAHLSDQGISAQVHYPTALPFCPAYQYLSHKPEDFPIAYRNQGQILSLPIYPELDQDKISFVCDQIKKFYS